MEGSKGGNGNSVPADWRMVSFADVAHYALGRTPPRKSSQYWASVGGFPWVTIADMPPFSVIHATAERVSAGAAAEVFQTPPVPAGTLLMSFKLTIGRTAVLGMDAYHNEAIIAIYPKSGIERDFLRFYLPTIDFSSRQDRAVKGHTLNKGKIDGLPVPLPPPWEQQAIAYILSRIQAAVEVQERIVATLRELKAATMAKLFREGLRGEHLKQTEIGEVPESWRVARLDSLADLVSGGTPSKSRRDWWQGSIPWASPKDIKRPRLLDTEDHISEEAVQAGSRMVPAKTIFVVIRGMALAKDVPIAMAEVPMAFNQDLKAIQAGRSIDPDYLLYAITALKTSLALDIGTSAHGTRRMGTSSLEAFLVPVPDRAEQREIAGILRTIENQHEVASGALNSRRSLFSSMLHELMSGRVRVTQRMIALQALEARRKRQKRYTGRIDEEKLHEIVRRIVEAVAPEKIILFGSAARGEMGPDSDVDLLVVKACEDRREVWKKITWSLIGTGVPKDVIVVTPEDIERYGQTIGLIYRPALREGTVIYAA